MLLPTKERCVTTLKTAVFLWRGDSKFKLQFLVILALLSEFFLKDVFK